MQDTKIKIALIGNSLSFGGADKVHANLSVLFDNAGFKVHNIIIIDAVSYTYSGQLFNLGKFKNANNTFINKINRLFKLRAYLKQNNFDFIIDFRTRLKPIQELFIACFIYNKNYILTVHSSNLKYYLPENKIITKLILNQIHSVVTVSKEIEDTIKELYNYKKVKTIYNPINFTENKINPLNYKFILAVGRMDLENTKQFDKLLILYKNSILPKENVRLVFLGDGNNKENLIKLSKKLEIDDITMFLGFKSDISAYYQHALFTVLCSKFEGFPNALCESLVNNTPVISFNCKTGPSEIITHNYNGLLVENQNFEKLTDAINLLYNDSDLRKFCKSNSKQSVAKYSAENIKVEWLEYLKKK